MYLIAVPFDDLSAIPSGKKKQCFELHYPYVIKLMKGAFFPLPFPTKQLGAPNYPSTSAGASPANFCLKSFSFIVAPSCYST